MNGWLGRVEHWPKVTNVATNTFYHSDRNATPVHDDDYSIYEGWLLDDECYVQTAKAAELKWGRFDILFVKHLMLH